MKIVIDLPEKTIAHIRSAYGHGKGFYPLNEEDKKIVNDAIYFGTPLPKEHGDLIDRSEVIKSLLDYYKGNKTIGQCVEDVQTIIEGSDSE